jgi:hypothetical protein
MAVTATRALHELGLDCFLIDFNAPAKERVQSLKCYLTGVEGMQFSQHREGRLAWAFVAYARKVGRKIDTH